jgi:hypothetical protein
LRRESFALHWLRSSRRIKLCSPFFFPILVFPFSNYATEFEYRWITRRGTDGQRMAKPTFILDENPVNSARAN